ncbi:MAG: hypothetical protein WC652_04595 [archaeon]|jgi:hypothetical protein
MNFDFGKILNFAFFDWFKQKGAVKYLAAYFIVLAALTLGTNYLISILASPLVGSVTWDETTLNAFIYLMGSVLTISIVLGVILSAIAYVLIGKALKAKGRNYEKLTAEKWVKFIVLGLAEIIASVFSVYKLKLLLIPVGAIITGLISIVLLTFFESGNWVVGVIGILLLLISLLLSFVYCVIIIHNAYRLILSPAIFVEGKSVTQALRLSWETTRGNVLNIFVLIIIVGVTAAVLGWIVSIPASLNQGAALIGAAENSNTFANLASPVSIALSIPAIIVQAIMIVVEMFAIVGLYDMLDKKIQTSKKQVPLAVTKKRSVLKAKKKK